jgi:exodeoxyribonuclease VII small subunit
MVEMKFEEALKKLEKIVDDLEAGEMSLDESLIKYEEGVKLSKLCSRQLEAAKSRVALLMKQGDKFILKDFEESAKEERPRSRSKRSKKPTDSETLF